jgi:hypothetical protein
VHNARIIEKPQQEERFTEDLLSNDVDRALKPKCPVGIISVEAGNASLVQPA